jgi:hypothetical protein
MDDLDPQAAWQPRIIQFAEGMRIITHPEDSHFYILGRDACGPFIGVADPAGVLVYGTALPTSYSGPGAQLALERLREEQEKDKREGVQYPDRCGPPLS